MIAKALSFKGNLSAAFRNEKGAFDLMSILFGVAIIGVLAGIAVAGFTLLLPWVQDSAAESQLGNVAQAQEVAFTSNSGAPYSGADFDAAVADATSVDITGANGVLIFDATNAGEPVFIYSNGVQGANADWFAVTQSASGAWYYVAIDQQAPVSLGNAFTDGAALVAALADEADYDAAKGILEALL